MPFIINQISTRINVASRIYHLNAALMTPLLKNVRTLGDPWLVADGSGISKIEGYRRLNGGSSVNTVVLDV